jgi:hypothetical protein
LRPKPQLRLSGWFGPTGAVDWGTGDPCCRTELGLPAWLHGYVDGTGGNVFPTKKYTIIFYFKTREQKNKHVL